MEKLSEDAVEEIDKIHSAWIDFEIAGNAHGVMSFCADDIELWPPDARPVLGRTAVLTQLMHGDSRIHAIEIFDRRIRGSNEIAYLTANYRTTFSSAADAIPVHGVGSHLWILQKRAGAWLVILVSWSSWGSDAG